MVHNIFKHTKKHHGKPRLSSILSHHKHFVNRALTILCIIALSGITFLADSYANNCPPNALFCRPEPEDPTPPTQPPSNSPCGLQGGSDQDRIWNYFIQAGYTEYATAGIIGAVLNESDTYALAKNGYSTDLNNAGHRQSGKFTDALSDTVPSSTAYSNRALDIKYNGVDGTDGGYGIFQWTVGGDNNRDGLFRRMREAGLERYYGAGFGNIWDSENERARMGEGDYDRLFELQLEFATSVWISPSMKDTLNSFNSLGDINTEGTVSYFLRRQMAGTNWSWEDVSTGWLKTQYEHRLASANTTYNHYVNGEYEAPECSNVPDARGVVEWQQCDSRWGGTLWSNGVADYCAAACVPTSFAILVTIFLGTNAPATPDIVIREAERVGVATSGGGVYGTWQTLADSYGLTYKNFGNAGQNAEGLITESNYEQVVSDALRDGWKFVTAGSGGMFYGGHAIAIYGITEEGDWLIADPFRYGYANTVESQTTTRKIKDAIPGVVDGEPIQVSPSTLRAAGLNVTGRMFGFRP